MSNLAMQELKTDPSLHDYNLDTLPLLARLKREFLERKAAVCIERAVLVTEGMKQYTEERSEIVRRAKVIRHYLANRQARFNDDNLIAGSTTSKLLGAPVYPELLGLSIWPELDTISTRATNPQQLTAVEADTLNFDVFPYWIDRTVLETVRRRLRKEGGATYESLRLMEKIAFYMAGKSTVISHTTPFYEEVLDRGLVAMMADAHVREMHAITEGNAEAVELNHAMQIAMQGIVDYARNLAERADQLARTAKTPDKAEHYAALARICSRVPAEPCETFREAVNALWLCHVGILAENVNMAMNPGRLDQVLYPYYKADMQAGRLTVQDALTLLGCLWLKISDNTNLVPQSAEKMFGGAGSVPAVTLGGVDKDGRDAVNDLTYLMLRVTELLAIRDPNVNARYYAGVNDTAYLDRVSQVIVSTRAIPALYNDVANIATLVNQGVSLEHARDYAVVGCVELGSAGREYASTSSILLNLSAAMDLTLFNGKRPYITGEQQIGPKTGEPKDLKTFDAFETAFETQLESLIERAISVNEALGEAHQTILPVPLLSCFFQGPAEKGKDLNRGGGLYNSSGVTHVAFADVCDSLNAIEDAVYTNHIATLEQVRDAVANDFKGFDALLEYVTKHAPKYGMDDSRETSPVAVKNSRRLVKFLYGVYQRHTNYRGGKYRPAFWTMTNHAGLGKIGAALPSGRRAHAVFSSGITPSSQFAKDLTGAYNSFALLGSEFIPGGVALNIKYSPPIGAGGNGYLTRFRQMVEAYFKSGGMQVQYNVQTYEMLEDARKHPEKYPDLIVRVSGYSAFFKDLNPAMQEELIRRSQYDLASGQLVPYEEVHS